MSTQAGASSTSAFDTTFEKPVQYSCGDCAAKVLLKRGDPIRCVNCGHRVLYKERTNR
jgi:DNA-directed RNA polymerase I, II, and III subunit RPABC4